MTAARRQHQNQNQHEPNQIINDKIKTNEKKGREDIRNFHSNIQQVAAAAAATATASSQQPHPTLKIG